MSDPTKEMQDSLRTLVSAAIHDLAGVLAKTEDPFIVGGQYSEKRLYQEIAKWAAARQFDLAEPAAQVWAETVVNGYLRGGKYAGPSAPDSE